MRRRMLSDSGINVSYSIAAPRTGQASGATCRSYGVLGPGGVAPMDQGHGSPTRSMGKRSSTGLHDPSRTMYRSSGLNSLAWPRSSTRRLIWSSR